MESRTAVITKLERALSWFTKVKVNDKASNTSLARGKEEVRSALAMVKAEPGEKEPTPPTPEPEPEPTPEPPPVEQPYFVGDSLSKWINVVPDGNTTMSNGVIKMATTNSTGVQISGNPRSEIVSPTSHKAGEHFVVDFKVRFPGSAKAALANFSGGSTFCLFFQCFGPPDNGSPPLKCEIKQKGTHIGWERNATGSYKTEWEAPIRFDDFMRLTYDVTLGAKVGELAPVHTYLDGVQIHSANVAIWDQGFTKFQVRLQQYRKINVFTGTIPFEFTGFIESHSLPF